MTGALHIGHALTAAIEVAHLTKFPFYVVLLCSLAIQNHSSQCDLLAGHNDSLAKNVWIQCFVGAWDRPCCDWNTGSISLSFIVDILVG